MAWGGGAAVVEIQVRKIRAGNGTRAGGKGGGFGINIVTCGVDWQVQVPIVEEIVGLEMAFLFLLVRGRRLKSAAQSGVKLLLAFRIYLIPYTTKVAQKIHSQ